MKSEYKKKYWDEGHRKSVSDVSRELAEFDSKHNSNNAFQIFYLSLHFNFFQQLSLFFAYSNIKRFSGTNLNDVDKLEKENLDAKLDILNNLEKKFSDAGPVYDCILFHDGEKWLCCVDTTDDGDLTKCRLLGEYSLTHDYAPLTEQDKLNVSINVHDNGDILELVAVCCKLFFYI